MDPLLVVLVCLVAAAFGGVLSAYVGIPRVVGQIGAGMLLGFPAVNAWLFDPASTALVGHLADIGIILLLFFTGLEINFRTLEKNFKTASGISFTKTVLTLAGGYVVGHYVFGLSPAVSFIVGVCLSVTATAIALDLLEEFNLFKTRLGALTVGTGAIDDFYELALITLSLSVIGAATAKTAFAGLILNAVIFVLAVILFRAFIIPLILRFVEKEGDEATLLMSGIIITLLMAGLTTTLGFGTIVGALVSGILVRQALMADVKHHRSWEAHHISRNAHTIAFGFLVPIFFVEIGVLTDVSAIWQNIGFGLAITFVAITGTILGCALAHYWARKQWRDGFILGLALNSKGDTALIISTIALEAGVISQALFSSLIFMAVVSTLFSPFVFRYVLERKTA